VLLLGAPRYQIFTQKDTIPRCGFAIIWAVSPI